ncbi:MAG: serine/threonine-protein phosphatase [bacterium]|nr:serine/threonine-protein phosphatase [bacterium]
MNIKQYIRRWWRRLVDRGNRYPSGADGWPDPAGKFMKYIVGNAQDIGNRGEQQDFFAFSDPGNPSFVQHGGLLGVVADGMGGMAYGRDAGEIAVKTFLRSYEGKSPGENIPDTLKDSLEQANRAVVTVVEEKGMSKGDVGSTLCAAVIHHRELYWVSVGDSRIYLHREGSLVLLTESHTIGNRLDRDAARGIISPEAALNDPQRHILFSYLGLDELPEIDIPLEPYPLQKGDRVILCSDGLFNGLSDAEIADGIENDLQESCERLVHRALSKNDPLQDNVTIIAMAPDMDDQV